MICPRCNTRNPTAFCTSCRRTINPPKTALDWQHYHNHMAAPGACNRCDALRAAQTRAATG